MHTQSKTVSETGGFNIERNGLFLSLARKCSLFKEVEFMASKVQCKELEIDWKIDAVLNLHSVIHEFLFVLARESYANSEFDLTTAILEFIDVKNLSSVSSKEMHQLSLKLKLPLFALKWMKDLGK